MNLLLDIWIKMMQQINSQTYQYAICVNNEAYPASLEQHKLYRLLPDIDAQEDGDVRVIDESGEDYLYPATHFLIVRFSPTVQTQLHNSFIQTEQAEALLA